MKPLLSGVFNEECATSELVGEWESTESGKANPNGLVTELTFGGTCKPCTKVTTKGFPYKTKMTATSTGNGTLAMVGGEVTLSGCPLGLSCTFRAETATLEFIGSEIEGKTKIIANKVSLSLVSGSEFCGKTLTWTATYSLIRLKEDLWAGATLSMEHNRTVLAISKEYGI